MGLERDVNSEEVVTEEVATGWEMRAERVEE